MAQNIGTLLGAAVRPNTTEDQFPAFHADEGKGGFYSVPNIAARNAIFNDRRVIGMRVKVISEDKDYELVGGITNADWVEKVYGTPIDFATQSENEQAATATDIATINNTKATTPRGLRWFWNSLRALAWSWSGKQTFSGGVNLSALTANLWLRLNGDKDIESFDGQAFLDAKVDKSFLPLALTGNINISTLQQNRVYVVTLGGADRTITIDVPTNILFILNSANTLTFAGSVTPLNDDLTLTGIGNSMLIEYLSGANSLASKKGFTQINPDDYPLNNFPQPVTQRFLREGIDRKADIVAGASFTTGTPRTFAVTFGTDFPDANYTITICGVDSRQWSYQSKSASGFTINSNSGTALTGEVTWTAEKI